MSRPTSSRRAPLSRELVVIALASCAVLFYQIAITRLLSVVLFYHFAFLSISVAMLGLGASGVWFSLRPAGVRTLPRLLAAASVAIPTSVWVIVRARPVLLACGLGQAAFIAVIVLAMLVPMYALGGVICVILLRAEGRSVAQTYAADLLGATCGAAAVVPLLASTPTPSLLAAVGGLPLLGLGLLAGFRQRAPWWLMGLAVLVALIAWREPFSVRYSKLYAEEGELRPLHEVWTSNARVTVFERPIFSPAPGVPWGWGYGARFEPAPHEERWIDQDGSAGTPIERLAGDPHALGHLMFDVTSAGYQVFGPRKVCIIGAGGGRDIVTALAAGARDVTAIELNRGIFSLMRGPLAEFSGRIYRRAGVRTHHAEGRSFLTQHAERHDLIQIALVDSWAATAAGAFALSENYLYTVEALRLYLSRLAPGGVLSISRWADRIQPFETARLVLLAEEALRQHGAKNPRAHLLLLSADAIGTLLVSEQPIDAARLASADRVAALRGFERDWPTKPGAKRVTLASLALGDHGAGLARAGVDLAPPTDDRPFFFQASRLWQLQDVTSKVAPTDINLAAVGILRQTFVALAVLAAGLFFAPLWLFAGPARSAGFWRGAGYFACIGLGFMLLEVPWIQRAVLFLDHPSTAAAVVLTALLLGAGIGAAWSGRLSPRTVKRVFWLLPLVAAAVTLGCGPLFRAALAYPVAARVVIAGVLFGSAGVCLGVALPVGLVLFGAAQRAWFWAINGAASVLASALAVALALGWGLTATSLVGVGCYVVAGLLLTAAGHDPPP
ncbi:MAG: hypothetical protein ABW321_17055 [Polyangiales bacterium]